MYKKFSGNNGVKRDSQRCHTDIGAIYDPLDVNR